MRNKKYDNSKIFIICRTEGQIKYIHNSFDFTASERKVHIGKYEIIGHCCFRFKNNIYQGFGRKEFYLTDYKEYKPVEFQDYFISTFVEIDENE